MDKKIAVGIDIGGSHISSVLVNMQDGCIIKESYAESKLNNQASANEIFQIWASTIKSSIGFTDISNIKGLGFAIPGPFDYANGIALLKGVSKYESLYGLNIKDELNKLLNLPSDIPFRYINDAMSFAIGESWSGQVAQYDKVMAITLGTGFGSAFIKNGVPVIEGESVPAMGYVYNIPYENSIADDYFSTRWFINEYETRTGVKCNGVKEIADKAQTEEAARALFVDFGRNLAQVLAPLLSQFDAQCLLIGGNISKAYSLFGSSLQAELKAAGVDVQILLSDLMEEAAMTGSARLIEDDYWAEARQIVSKI